MFKFTFSFISSFLICLFLHKLLVFIYILIWTVAPIPEGKSSKMVNWTSPLKKKLKLGNFKNPFSIWLFRKTYLLYLEIWNLYVLYQSCYWWIYVKTFWDKKGSQSYRIRIGWCCIWYLSIGNIYLKYLGGVSISKDTNFDQVSPLHS